MDYARLPTAQGERQGGGQLNLGYRRKLTEKLAFQLTVRVLLDNFGDTLVTETSTFPDRADREFGGRAWFVGLTYSFGATPKRERDPQFDFSAPTTGGGGRGCLGEPCQCRSARSTPGPVRMGVDGPIGRWPRVIGKAAAVSRWMWAVLRERLLLTPGRPSEGLLRWRKLKLATKERCGSYAEASP